MKNSDLIDEILAMIRSMLDDRKQLEQLHAFLKDNFFNNLEIEEKEIIIPEKYRALVKEAADNVDANFVFYLNTETSEVFTLPKDVWAEFDNDFANYEAITGDETLLDEMKKVEENWTGKIMILPPESHISYTYMDRFVNSLPESSIKIKLREAIEGRKPFRHFNNLIHESDIREDWFAFRRKCIQEYVAEIFAESLWNDEVGN